MFRITLLLVSLLFVFPIIANACTLKVGVVPQFEKRKLVKVWNPILEELEKQVGCGLEFIGSETILQFEGEFKDGKFDLAYMNPYHAVMANDAQGYQPIARSGAKMLKGILTVHKDSGITDLSQLNGKTLAFPSPNALGASLLMRAELKRKHNIDIEPLYVKTHSSTYLHVVKQLTAAGGGVMRTLKEQKASIQNKLNILYTTTPVSAHPLVIHPRIDAELKTRVQKAWLAMTEADNSVFDGIPMKRPIASTMADYDPLRKLGLEDFVGVKE